jgi:hypothetical protein
MEVEVCNRDRGEDCYHFERCFYSDVHANIFLWSGAKSRTISVQRGVRQGDPLSTLLFNLVLNEVLEEVGIVWRRRSYGADMGSFL